MNGAKNRLEIPLVGQTVLHLAAVPPTTCTPDPPTTRLDQLENTFPITGTCTNIPDQTPCTIEVVVLLDGQTTEIRPRPDEANRQGFLKVNGGKFEIEALASPGGTRGPVVLDLFKDSLVGKGRLRIKIKPDIPHCNDGADAKLVVDFDNRAEVTVSCDPPGAPAEMGIPVRFDPTWTGAFRSLRLQATIVEYEGDLAPKPGGASSRDAFTPQGLKKLIDWEPGIDAAKIWRLGCTDGDTPDVQFLYPEPDEILPYEFAWNLSALRPDGTAVEVLRFKALATVNRPRLTEFRLSREQEVGRWESDVPIAGYRVKANVTFMYLAEGIRFPYSISLWRAVHDGDGTKLECLPIGDRQFLYEARKSAREELAFLPDVEGLFGVLRFPGLPMPIARIFDCDDLPFFDVEGASGIFSSPVVALCICSEEAKALRPKIGLLDLEGVKQVMWKDRPAVKPRLQRVLNGSFVLTPKQCPQDVALSVQKALLALGISIVEEGSTTTEAGYGQRTNKAFGKFLCTHRDGVFQNLMVDEHGVAVDQSVFPLFEKSVDEVSSEELSKLPVVPMNARGFEVLLTAVAEKLP